jgi:3-hydroxyisobutyrate dehydrogenase
MLGGNNELLSEISPILECYSKAIYHMGDVGAGQEAKCANQIGVALAIAAVTESLYFSQQKGLPIDKMLEILQGGSAGSWACSTFGPKILAGDYKPGFYAKDMLKDLRIALKEAEESLTPLPITGLIKELYTALLNKKGDKLGNHGLIEIYKELGNKNF